MQHTIRQRLLSSAAAIALGGSISGGLSLTLATAALANGATPVDYIVDTATTVTNGDAANVLDGNDSLTITESGSITPSSGFAGAEANGVNNTITNSGSISTSGNYAFGAYIDGDDGSITNSGDIMTIGDGADGAFIDGDYGSITNSDSITTDGINASGAVILGDYGSITNSGDITTGGANAYGAQISGSDGSIDNSGTITTGGNNAFGAYIGGPDGSITNSGDITTGGDNAYGAYIFGSDGSIDNSGSITTSGDYADGAFISGGNGSIDNSGSIATGGIDAYGAYIDGDGGSITNSGTITTSGGYAEGAYISGNDGSIVNSGSIATGGFGAEGAFISGNDSSIVNSGSIATGGFGAEGAFISGNDSSIVNSGTIATGGINAEGAFISGYDGSIVNSGSITTTGNFADGAGIYEDYGSITNSGTITTSGDAAYGAYINGDSGSITNSGTITTSGDGAEGAYIDGNGGSIVNSGSITTSGDAANGIVARGGGNTIANSGRIISTSGNAILFSGAGGGNTLNLDTRGFIAGAIDLGAGGTTVNIVNAPGHSVLWQLNGAIAGTPTFTGTAPIFYNENTQQVATFDATGLAAAPQVLATVSGDVSNLVRDRLNALPPFPQGDAAGPANGAWISTFGSYFEFDGEAGTLDHDFTNFGFAIGYDRAINPDLTVGVLAGYGVGTLEADGIYAQSYDNEANGWFAAVYGRKTYDNFFLDLALSGGMLDHSDDRFVNDNLAPGGIAVAGADYDSWWFSPEASIGADFAGPQGWTFTPSARIRYAAQSIDGYTESGSNANATVGDRDIGILEGRVEVAATRTFDFATLTARVGWLGRDANGDDDVNVSLIGQTLNLPTEAEDYSAAFLGARARVDLAPNTSLDLGGDVTFGDGITGISGSARIGYQF